jgi:hypothetical protein
MGRGHHRGNSLLLTGAEASMFGCVAREIIRERSKSPLPQLLQGGGGSELLPPANIKMLQVHTNYKR